MSRMLVDFHHSSLLRSHVLTFEQRLEIDVYRPIGLEWFDQGYWAINDQRDTADQFLSLDQKFEPADGTPALNQVHQLKTAEAGTYWVADPGLKSFHRAATLDFFTKHEFDYILASIPAHVEPFKALRDKYWPNAKLIVQMGNNWSLERYRDFNVLASIAPQPASRNVMFYHQEFDLNVFYDSPVAPARNIYSFVNVIEKTGLGWRDYQDLKRLMERLGWKVRAYGGQCPDGNMTGAFELAAKMREASFIFHVKPGGDGFGHIIHNAYAVGRPLITRPSHYRGQLAERLLVPGTFVDLDRYSGPEVKNILTQLMLHPDDLVTMGKAAAARFDEVVDYGKQAAAIGAWLERIK